MLRLITLLIYVANPLETKVNRGIALNPVIRNKILKILIENGETVASLMEALNEWSGIIAPKDTEEKVNGRIMDIDELTTYLKPYKIPKGTLYKYTMKPYGKKRKIPCFKRGKRLFFYKNEIDMWLRSKF